MPDTNIVLPGFVCVAPVIACNAVVGVVIAVYFIGAAVIPTVQCHSAQVVCL